jgi:NDP-sugar pyrophosphorylase family protein
MDATDRIERFTEKPKREEATSNWINAGTYIMEPDVLAGIPARQRWSVERAVFPGLLRDGRPLYGYRSNAYWMDIGTPDKYLQAHATCSVTAWRSNYSRTANCSPQMCAREKVTFVHTSASITGPVVLGKNCHISGGAAIIGPTVLGDNCFLARALTLNRWWHGRTPTSPPIATVAIVWSLQTPHIGADCIVENGAIVGTMLQRVSATTFRGHETLAGYGAARQKHQLLMSKDSLLLLHGALGASSQFAPLTPLLEDRFEVHTARFRRHGTSPTPMTVPSPWTTLSATSSTIFRRTP